MNLRRVCAQLILSMLCLSGCNGSGVDQRGVETAEESIEDAYLGELKVLTEIMRNTGMNPEQRLDELRRYSTSSKAKLSESVKVLNMGILSLSEEDRRVWRRGAQKKLELALNEFSLAQRELLGQLNEAQKWELGEIFRTLQ